MELHTLDEACLDILERMPGRHSSQCMRSAINHLQRAETLFEVDRPMAVFRCFTAEEEAATGIFHCLKELDYPGAERLLVRSHPHKNAVIAFMRVVHQHFYRVVHPSGVNVDIELFEEGHGRRLRLAIVVPTPEGELTIRPEPPLQLAFTPGTENPLYTIDAQAFANTQGAVDILRYVDTQANARNRLLYATPRGFPHGIEIEMPTFFNATQARVFALLRLYLLIAPHRERQAYVQQLLDAFLATMVRLPRERQEG